MLPPGLNKTQKVVVGDQSGVLQCFSIKKGELALSFKTLPSDKQVPLAHHNHCVASVLAEPLMTLLYQGSNPPAAVVLCISQLSS